MTTLSARSASARRTTPSARIADDIRHRISRGELSPGDKVPSTRRITQEWGVAMATASKALASLAQEGLVRAVPGVGTVVVDATAVPALRHGRTPGGLSRARIVRTAIALADSEGLVTLTMRRVATDLGVSTMALYRHVPGKADLVHLMSEAAFAERPLGEPHGGVGAQDWRRRLAHAARWLWQIYERHPWMTQAMASFTRPTAAPEAMRYTEWVLRALNGHGLSSYEMLHTHLTLFGHIQGLAAATEVENRARQDTGMTSEEWMASHEPHAEAVQSAGGYPTLGRLFEEEGDFVLDLDALFAFGLERILDGVQVLISRRAGSR
ncbi:TetR/AcrR family transcriptional regulator C-terminal domain-containing protein (plasmid) [Streptomyces sp. CA-294286]|uniref:TetR/AcrR family transcriptional regulator C-terminal domain-containing protein n=1 Tax=Streptomyces sp. CA-294286 TaxID=3240070 RepID=UPI003D89C9C3